MAGKVDRRIQRTRVQLQEALVSLILEKGFDDLTVQDVIDRANVGRSTFYAHFEGKEDLFLSGFTGMQAHLEQYLKSQSDGDESLWALSRMMFEHAAGHDRIYKALVGKRGGHLMLAHMHQFLLGLVRTQLKKQRPGSPKQAVPPELLAHHLVSSLTAMLTWWLDHGKPYSPEQMAQYYRQVLRPAPLF